MRPVLFSMDWGSGPVPIRAYETALLLAAVLAVGLGYRLAVRRGLPRRSVLLVLFCSGAAALAGARAMHVLAEGEWGPGLLKGLLDLRATRFSLSGGLLAGLFAGWAVCQYQGLCPWRVGDALAPALALGIAMARVGCWLQGCCFGGETRLPWGVSFPWGSPAHLQQLAGGRLSPVAACSLPVHPTQLYELAAALLSAVVAVFLLRQRVADGIVLSSSAALFLTFRCVTLTQRAVADPAAWLNLVLLGMLSAVLIWRWRQGKAPGSETCVSSGGVIASGTASSNFLQSPRT